MALFWFSDEAWTAIEPHLPKNQPGARRVDNHRVISGILHVPKVGCRWCDGPSGYGPSTTIYNSTDGRGGASGSSCLVSDVTAAPALRERAGQMRCLLDDRGYDADRLRRSLREAGATPVIQGRRNRKRLIRYDHQRHRGRHLIENAFCRLKDFCRVATRVDKLAANFLSGVALATAVAFWL